jgi:hypothetical protein
VIRGKFRKITNLSKTDKWAFADKKDDGDGGGSGRVNQLFLLATNQGKVTSMLCIFVSGYSG